MLHNLERGCRSRLLRAVIAVIAVILCAWMTSTEAAALPGVSAEVVHLPTAAPVLTSVPAAVGFAVAATSAAAESSVEFLPYAAGAQTRPAGARRQGVLYKVSLGAKVAYLFGTIHVGEQSLYPLADEVSLALSEADELIVELDTRAERAFTQAVLSHGSYATGEHIKNFVSPATMERLTAALHAKGITVASMAHMKPWLIANILMGLELQRSGLDRTHGNESILLDYAHTRGMPVVELESAAYQLGLFDTLSPAQSESYLLESLARLSDGSAMRKARATVDAWSSGSASALDELIPDAVSGDGVIASFTRQTLLGRRNPQMAARIEDIMRGGHTLFVGVGLLHLLGADGLPRLLSQRGYRVERMY